MQNLTEFERLTLDQVLIECGRDEPSEQDIEHAKRIVRDCNFYRRFNNLKEIK